MRIGLFILAAVFGVTAAAGRHAAAELETAGGDAALTVGRPDARTGAAVVSVSSRGNGADLMEWRRHAFWLYGMTNGVEAARGRLAAAGARELSETAAVLLFTLKADDAAELGRCETFAVGVDCGWGKGVPLLPVRGADGNRRVREALARPKGLPEA